MQSQGQFEKERRVREAIISPMLRLYQPPSHVRTDKEAFNTLIAEYVKGLSRFPKPTLEKAWEMVKEDHSTWIWPHLKAIRDACMKVTPAERTPDQAAGETPLQKKAESARKMIGEYMKQFHQSHLFLKAISEKWDLPLEQYALDAASAQASIICGLRNWGYSFRAYQYRRNDSRELMEKRRREFEDYCRRQAATGHINVDVPNEAIEAWKGEKAA